MTMKLMHKFFNNARKPEGFLGKIMVMGMNGCAHATMARWALSQVDLQDANDILDIGCGGGANVARFLKMRPEAKVTGIDYSEVSVAKSRKVNNQAINEGRCQILEGNVAALPFDDASFDFVSAFETVYFWPAIVDSFRQVRRVLRKDGRFLIVNEADGEGGGVEWDKIVEGMHTYTPQELEAHLRDAGFQKVDIIRDTKNHRLCVVAQ